MSSGEGPAQRHVARWRALGARRSTLPALVVVLALFSVEALQLLTSVVRDDLTAPSLAQVTPIDLGSSPAQAVARAAARDVAVPGAAATIRADGATPAPAEISEVTVDVPADGAPPDAPRPTAAAPSVEAVTPDVVLAVSAPAREASVRPAPPRGRAVGPDCAAETGRRAACDRRPPV